MITTMDDSSLQDPSQPQPPPRKLSAPDRFGRQLSIPHENTDAFSLSQELNSPKVEDVPQGIVKGFGGAFEKIAANNAAEAGRSRGGTPVKTPAVAKSMEKSIENNGNTENQAPNGESEDSVSIVVDPQLLGRWFLICVRNDTCALKQMVREEPRLARVRDVTNGYTALHWAAHHANVEITRFLVDGYSANVNAKSRAGYTPLHVAFQRPKNEDNRQKRDEMIDVLLHNCKAELNEIDYSGKRPDQYSGEMIKSHIIIKPIISDGETQKKTGTVYSAMSTGMRRFGTMGKEVRKSMMKRLGTGKTTGNIRPSSSFHTPPMEEESGFGDGESAQLPPAHNLLRHKNRIRSHTDLMRRGSNNSDISRSDSVLSVEDLRSLNVIGSFDSGSDNVSFHESESYDSFISTGEFPQRENFQKDQSSPLVYTKSLTEPDGGSQV